MEIRKPVKVAVLGSDGQLGSDLVKALKDFEVLSYTQQDIEVTDPTSIEKLEEARPDVIINTAAFLKVDACEDGPFKAFNVNAVGSKNVAQVCKVIGCTYVYISTDFVFDGNKGDAYLESDYPCPINTYGISKLAGEQYAKISERHYIIRGSSLFGVAGAMGKGGNFVETIIKKSMNNEEIKVVDDIIMSVNYTIDAAEMIKTIISKDLPYGIYHIANAGHCSWHEFSKAILEMLGIKAKLTSIKVKDLAQKARRPKFSVLRSERLCDFGLEMRPWEEALRSYLREKGHL